MLRSMLASLALALLGTATAFAGDCGCGARHGRPAAFNSNAPHVYSATGVWGGSNCGGSCGGSCGMPACGDSCGDACSDPCNTCSCKGRGCGKCCFPLLRGAVHAVGKVINFVIPHPCCRSGCNSCASSCCDSAGTWDPTSCTTCGTDYGPASAPNGAVNPFIDDQPAPTPMPSKEARSSKSWQAPVVVKSSGSNNMQRSIVNKAAKPTPATKISTKPVNSAKPAPRNVMKLAHSEQIEDQIEEELSSRLNDDSDSAPVAPTSIRLVGHEERREPAVAPVAKRGPVNPLR